MADLNKNDYNQNGYNQGNYQQNGYNQGNYQNYNQNGYNQGNYQNNYNQNGYNQGNYQNNYNQNTYAQNAYDNTYNQQNGYVQNNGGYNQQPSFNGNFENSNFDGSVLDTFIHLLAGSLMMTFTCGIATPWALCFIWSFIVSHITIDGKRLSFDGTGGQLFGNWIKWFLLTVITFGIYGFWVYPKLFSWVAKHTHFMN